MTIQSFIFLHQIKKVQRSELGTIRIDAEQKTMQTRIDEESCASLDQVTIDLSKKWKTVDNLTDYLQDEGLLERVRYGEFYLSHKGYHYVQAIIFNFLFKSIAVPIVVALITTLVTLWLQGIFSIK